MQLVWAKKSDLSKLVIQGQQLKTVDFIFTCSPHLKGHVK